MPSLSDDDLAAWRAFLNAHALITRRISRELNAADLPDLSWYDALWALYSQPEQRLQIHELADAVVLSATGMSRFVDRLESAGLVRRELVPSDRRAFHVVITDAGVAMLRSVWPIYERGIARYFAPFLKANHRSSLEKMAEAARPSSK